MNLDLITKALAIYNAIKGQFTDKKTETIVLFLVGADLVLRVLNG